MKFSNSSNLILDNHQNQGIFENSRMCHSICNLLGCVFRIRTKEGQTFEGVLQAFNKNFEVALSLVQEIHDGQEDELPREETVHEKMIFNLDCIATLSTVADLDAVTKCKKGFATDAEIGSRCNGNGEMMGRQLEAWEPDHDDHDHHYIDDVGNGSGGWTAEEMFERNIQLHGVVSTYKDDLRQFSNVEIAVDETSVEYKEQLAKAERIARSIELNPASKKAAELENDDEERDIALPPRSSVSSVDSSATSLSNADATNKTTYVPPGRRRPPDLQQQSNRGGVGGRGGGGRGGSGTPTTPRGSAGGQRTPRDDYPGGGGNVSYYSNSLNRNMGGGGANQKYHQQYQSQHQQHVSSPQQTQMQQQHERSPGGAGGAAQYSGNVNNEWEQQRRPGNRPGGSTSFTNKQYSHGADDGGNGPAPRRSTFNKTPPGRGDRQETTANFKDFQRKFQLVQLSSPAVGGAGGQQPPLQQQSTSMQQQQQSPVIVSATPQNQTPPTATPNQSPQQQPSRHHQHQRSPPRQQRQMQKSPDSTVGVSQQKVVAPSNNNSKNVPPSTVGQQQQQQPSVVGTGNGHPPPRPVQLQQQQQQPVAVYQHHHHQHQQQQPAMHQSMIQVVDSSQQQQPPVIIDYQQQQHLQQQRCAHHQQLLYEQQQMQLQQQQQQQQQRPPSVGSRVPPSATPTDSEKSEPTLDVRKSKLNPDAKEFCPNQFYRPSSAATSAAGSYPLPVQSPQTVMPPQSVSPQQQQQQHVPQHHVIYSQAAASAAYPPPPTASNPAITCIPGQVPFYSINQPTNMAVLHTNGNYRARKLSATPGQQSSVAAAATGQPIMTAPATVYPGQTPYIIQQYPAASAANAAPGHPSAYQNPYVFGAPRLQYVMQQVTNADGSQQPVYVVPQLVQLSNPYQTGAAVVTHQPPPNSMAPQQQHPGNAVPPPMTSSSNNANHGGHVVGGHAPTPPAPHSQPTNSGNSANVGMQQAAYPTSAPTPQSPQYPVPPSGGYQMVVVPPGTAGYNVTSSQMYNSQQHHGHMTLSGHPGAPNAYSAAQAHFVPADAYMQFPTIAPFSQAASAYPPHLMRSTSMTGFVQQNIPNQAPSGVPQHSNMA